MAANPQKAHLLGLALDGADGHKRLTRADNFTVLGGSAETHERMTETIVKTAETLKHRGKSFETVDRAELTEIIHESAPR